MKEKGSNQKVEDLYDSLSGMPMKISAFHKVWTATSQQQEVNNQPLVILSF